MANFDSTVASTIARICRKETGQVIATLARVVGDVGVAEEIAQDALVLALERWPDSGIPDSPGAWLMATAKNRALDHVRRRRTFQAKEDSVAWHEENARGRPASPDEMEAVADDLLRLVFTACHPSLPREAQVALTLRLVGGLTTAEIARAFLVPEATMAQRIVRAKRTLKDLAIPYEIPGATELAPRLSSVLEVIYLVFNEGYTAASGSELLRAELCEEAIRLGSVLVLHMPDAPEPLGLLAMMEIQASRSAARVGDDGQLVLLADQDRARWDSARIARALSYLQRAAALGGPGANGPYVIEAEIAACHARATSREATDWHRIAALYGELNRLTPSPVIELNRAVAVSLADGPLAALIILDTLADAPGMASYHLLPAVRADVLRRLGRMKDAASEYRRAIALADNDRERDFLERRLLECSPAS